MKVTYDYDKGTKTCTCLTCGYKHTEETKAYGITIEGDEKFIEMDITLHTDNNSIYYQNHRSYQMYACPKCGVLQLWTQTIIL